MEAFVQTGDFVRRGDKLLAYNPAVMEKARCSMNTPFVFCNTQEGWRVELLRTGLVSAGEDLVQLVPQEPSSP